MLERGNAGRCSAASTASAVTRLRAWGVGTVSASTRFCRRSSRVCRATSGAKTLKNSGIAHVFLRSALQSPGGLPRHDFTGCYCRDSVALSSIDLVHSGLHPTGGDCPWFIGQRQISNGSRHFLFQNTTLYSTSSRAVLILFLQVIRMETRHGAPETCHRAQARPVKLVMTKGVRTSWLHAATRRSFWCSAPCSGAPEAS